MPGRTMARSASTAVPISTRVSALGRTRRTVALGLCCAILAAPCGLVLTNTCSAPASACCSRAFSATRVVNWLTTSTSADQRR